MESPIVHEFEGHDSSLAHPSNYQRQLNSNQAASSSSSSSATGCRIPSNKINLRLILVTGKTKDFLFNANDSAADIANHVFDNWPQEWTPESVSRAEILRLIYQGRFLHGNVTLGALQLPLGRTSVMHLVPRENLPEPNSQDQRLKSKERSSGCCSASCSVL
ncbi:Ubiquitin-like protein 3 [Halotydeus destructor]|nr:Ubiquitin-like protein 3 [Halotydeus destructor]